MKLCFTKTCFKSAIAEASMTANQESTGICIRMPRRQKLYNYSKPLLKATKADTTNYKHWCSIELFLKQITQCYLIHSNNRDVFILWSLVINLSSSEEGNWKIIACCLKIINSLKMWCKKLKKELALQSINAGNRRKL